MAREKAKDIWFGGATQVFFRWWEEVGGIFVGSFYCNFNFFVLLFFFPSLFQKRKESWEGYEGHSLHAHHVYFIIAFYCNTENTDEKLL